MLSFLWDNLGIVLLLAAYVAAAVVAYVYGGWRAAAAVITFGAGHVLYRTGRKHERSGHNARADKIEKDRQDAYDKIDNRGTTRNDAADRLRKGDY